MCFLLCLSGISLASVKINHVYNNNNNNDMFCLFIEGYS